MLWPKIWPPPRIDSGGQCETVTEVAREANMGEVGLTWAGWALIVSPPHARAFSRPASPSPTPQHRIRLPRSPDEQQLPEMQPAQSRYRYRVPCPRHAGLPSSSA